ncbi:AAA family ATPase, partial [Acinetobacter baumannii]
EHKLTGWFDPPTVLKKGYGKDSYFDGPLAEAMRKGAILFVNELNRLPEGEQNVLLPALDEKRLEIPRIGELAAKEGFTVIATQNPREF